MILDESRITLAVGEIKTLKSNVTPEGTVKKITWKVLHGNDNVGFTWKDELAPHANAKIKALKEGIAIISASIDENFDGGGRTHIDTCWVDVVNKGTKSDVPDSLSSDGFAGWYIPYKGNPGVKSRVPRFGQLKAGPCFGYCMMMGDYYLRFRNINVNEFFNNRFTASYGNTEPYLVENNGKWVNVSLIEKDFLSFDELKPVLIEQLNSEKPVIVSGNDGTWNHFALVVAYVNEGKNKSDFITIDPLMSYPFTTTYEDFREAFKKDTDSELKYKNTTYIFNKNNYN